MTRYTVVWCKDALNELTQLWLAALDRDAITLAAHEIDVALATDAERKGNAVSEGLRAFLALPLRILFEVREGDRVVEILKVKFA